MIGEVTHSGGLSGLSGRITLVAGEAIFQVNVSYYICENATRGCKMYVNASYFSATARWATWPTWGPDPHISFFFLCRLSLSLVRENPALLLETFIMLLPRYFWSVEYFTFGSKAPLVTSRLKWASIQNGCSFSGLSCLVLSHALAYDILSSSGSRKQGYKQVALKLSGALMTVVMPCTCLALSESGLPVCAWRSFLHPFTTNLKLFLLKFITLKLGNLQTARKL